MFELVAGLEPFADRISTDASMDDLVASSSARLSALPFLESQLGAADERRRSSSAGAVPISATLPNPNAKKNSWSVATILGAVAIVSIIGLGAAGLILGRSTPSTAPPVASSAAPLRETAIVDFSVIPPDASVEVDGRPVEVIKGNLKIKGIVGTVHHVRAFVGAREARAEVVISLDGAIPSRIEVAVAQGIPATSVSAAASPAVTVPVKR